MPDANGDPTDNELVSSLGWTESEGDSLASDIGTGTEPSQPVAEAAPGVTAPQVPPPTGNPEIPQVPPADPLRQQLEQQNKQLQEQQVQTAINQQAQQYMTQLVTQGWGEDQAGEAARQYAQGQYQNYMYSESQRTAETHAKNARALELSNQYGVPRDQLMNYGAPSGMEQAAKMYYETQGRIRELESKFNSNNLAPSQSFDSNSMAASNSPQAKKLLYATNPNYQPTEDDFRAMGFGG